MKKLYIFFIPLFITFTFISTFALTNEQVFDYIYIDNPTLSKPIIQSIISQIDSAHGQSVWENNYYSMFMGSYNTTTPDPSKYWLILMDKLTSESIVYRVDSTTGSITSIYTDAYAYIFNADGTMFKYWGIWHSGVVGNDTIYGTNSQGEPGLVLYSNVPVKYTDQNNNLVYLVGRNIPYDYFPTGHPMSQPPVDVLPGDQVDSIVDTNLISILDEFNIDLLFENLESVLEQIYGFIESAFLSLNEVITYITSSLNNVVSFVTANITIISIISMVYLALPSILRDLFTLALSTSVVFIMLRRFI